LELEKNCKIYKLNWPKVIGKDELLNGIV